MNVIDLRSDTVTLPTPAMYEAMVSAPLGDDVFGGDPTVQRLEKAAAGAMGKEAAVLTASGTMSNLVALLSHCERGNEVILGDESHILHYEVGGAFALGGLGLRPVPNDAQGRLDLEEVGRTVRGSDVHWPRTGLLCVENTHNRCGGTVLTEADLEAASEVARKYGLPVHLDGARVFNAAVALGVPAERLARHADSVAFSLCKGLACPIGSVLCGSGEFIGRARRYRKMVGGGMRQAGVIAAAGIVALEAMVERLAEDHENARVLAEGLSGLEGIELAPPPQTNLVFFTVAGWDLGHFMQRTWQAGVLCLPEGGRIRMVTHYGIGREEVEEAVARVRKVLAAPPGVRREA
ncbi:MAG: low-specificity L-threonine aldolase [Chloroflexi bacterium]|nr:low-specificity L-threonine aldolase [Chloroflexota bacterium]